MDSLQIPRQQSLEVKAIWQALAEAHCHLAEIKYQSVRDATLVLGNPLTIRRMFVGFQQHLYSKC